MPQTRRLVAAIIGNNSPSQSVFEMAEAIGCSLVDAGFRIATGGLGGVMTAASRGGRASTAWTEGSIIGGLPGLDADAANPYVDIAIPTGMNYARNTLLVALADVVIAVGGGAGTLSEMALAWQHDKPIIALDVGDGWSAQLAGVSLDHRHAEPIHRATTPSEAIDLATQLAPRSSHKSGF